SRLNLANVLDDATNRQIPTFAGGPAPRTDLDQGAIPELSGAFADVCGRRRIAYVETCAPLHDHEQCQADLAAAGGSHRQQAGYGLIAWLVLPTGWHAWLGLPEEGCPTGLPAGAARPPRPAPACRRAAPAHRRAALPGSR